jgi:hypothetical protein
MAPNKRSADDAGQSDFRDQVRSLRAEALELLGTIQSQGGTEIAATLEKAAQALKISHEMEKTHEEIQKLALEREQLQYQLSTAKQRDKSESKKILASILVPIASILSLMVNSMFQSYQFSQTEKDKRIADRQAAWNQLMVALPGGKTSTPSVIGLREFLADRDYRERAMAVSVSLMANSHRRLDRSKSFVGSLRW